MVSLKLIDTAKVPVLKLAMDSDGVLFNVDITVDGQATPHSGLMAWYEHPTRAFASAMWTHTHKYTHTHSHRRRDHRKRMQANR